MITKRDYIDNDKLIGLKNILTNIYFQLKILLTDTLYLANDVLDREGSMQDHGKLGINLGFTKHVFDFAYLPFLSISLRLSHVTEIQGLNPLYPFLRR